VKKKRFSEEQIIAVLKEFEAGAKVPELCRKRGILDGTFYNWKAKYAGMAVAELRRLKELEPRTYRLYREQGLLVRKRMRKRIAIAEWRPLPRPTGPSQSWSMDYVADALIDGQSFACLRLWMLQP
jgi:putative transposase